MRFLSLIFCLTCATLTFAQDEIRYDGKTMGTFWKVTQMPEPGVPEVTNESIQAVLDAVDGRMSTWKPDSELSRINAAADISQDIPLSPELATVLLTALDISRQTGGAYDVTVGPLVNLWRFGPEGRDEKFVPPTDAQIAAAKAKTGWDALEIYVAEDGTPMLRRKKPGLYIDLSSIAKGYAVDAVAETLLAAGVTRFMIEVGGEVRVGRRKSVSRPWQIGIENPLFPEGRPHAAVQMENTSLASSGGYRNFKELKDGKLASHIIDPRTGRPMENRPMENRLLGVSVLAETCMEADAWATALSVLGSEEGLRLAKSQNPPLRVMFLVDKNGGVDTRSHKFPLIMIAGEVESFSPTTTIEHRTLHVIVLSVILSVIFFLLFFVAVGLNHLIGRRKMMCSCKAARAMEAEREQLIRDIRPIEEEKE